MEYRIEKNPYNYEVVDSTGWVLCDTTNAKLVIDLASIANAAYDIGHARGRQRGRVEAIEEYNRQLKEKLL